MASFPTCKITVLKTLYDEDLSKEYRPPREDTLLVYFFVSHYDISGGNSVH